VGELRLRPAQPDDAELVFGWANDPVTRAASFSSAPIAWADHLAWFTAQRSREDRHLFVAELEAVAVAVVRLDASASRPGVATISINVAPEARGRGLGVAALEAATATATALGFATICALIRPDNHASRRAFARAGYELDAETVVDGELALRYVKACPS
jgi:RimJ/RimL family protein N-acetyltransferase